MTASLHRLMILTAATLALAACQPEQPAADAAPAADSAAADSAMAAPDAAAMDVAPATPETVAEPAKIPGTDATAAVDNAQASAGFDAKAFAGVFTADDGTRIELKTDGTYAMSGQATGSGTWTAEADGKQLLLDSDDKAESDRRYDVVSQDQLKATEGGQALRRDGAP